MTRVLPSREFARDADDVSSTLDGHPATSLPGIVAALRAGRDTWRERDSGRRHASAFPSRAAAATIVESLAAALYPRRLGQFDGAARDEDRFVAERVAAGLTLLEREIGRELCYWQAESTAEFPPEHASIIAELFAGTLPDIRAQVDDDVEAAFLSDPAARSTDEILICYPGAIASLYHRIAHQLHLLGAPIAARLISALGNERTGIDIHPGAAIGRSFFINHGTGVVIGETAVVGDRVRIYQHVTLGARTAPGAARRHVRAGTRRHPIVGDDVVIYAGATILGPVSIGSRSIVGGNVWLLTDVAPDSIAVQPEARRLHASAADDLRGALHEAA